MAYIAASNVSEYLLQTLSNIQNSKLQKKTLTV